MNHVQELLTTLRKTYLQDLPNSIDAMESQILQLERQGFAIEIARELYRNAHSIKGSGGTHGMHIISDICHALEDVLSRIIEHQGKDMAALAALSLAHIDLLRELVELYQAELNPREDEVRQRLQQLRAKLAGRTITALVIDNSELVCGLIKDVLLVRKFRVLTMNDGYFALGRLLADQVDVLITSVEIQRLNGLALIAAAEQLAGKHKPRYCYLMTASDLSGDKLKGRLMLKKDAHLRETLSQAVNQWRF